MKISFRILFPGLLLLLLFAFVLNISIGSVAIPIREVFRILWFQESDQHPWLYIVQSIRFPKAVTAVLAGAALSVSGLQMQTLFRNPLAGPSELGITAGAGLGVAAIMLGSGSVTSLYAVHQLGFSASTLLITMASLGSAVVFLIILALAGRLRDHVTLLIVGVMMGTLTLSLVSIWQYFSSPEQLQDYLLWTFGSLGGLSGSQLVVLSLVVGMGLLLAFTSSKALNALLIGEHYSQSMGISVRRSRLLVLTSTSLLTGSITAFCGPIGFIGIAVPYFTRSLLGTSDHRLLIPANAVLGSVLLLSCDTLAHLPASGSVLPINILTSLLGAPVVIWIIIRRNNLRAVFA